MLKLFDTELCKCNNCELLLVDKNPQINAQKYPVYVAHDLHWMSSENIEVLPMEMFYNKLGFSFWGCPICETDDFLTDI
jgi:hypothetical protein